MSDLLGLFFKDVGVLSPLDTNKEGTLSKTIQECVCCVDKPLKDRCTTCRDAINTFVLHNLLLVVRIARRYQRNDFEMEDLVGFGIPGLFTAALKFDCKRNVSFASYASFWIKDSILKAIRTCAGTPKIPLCVNNRLWKVVRARTEITHEGLDNTVEEISSRTNLSPEIVKDLQQLCYQYVSLEDIEDFIGDQSTPETEFVVKERNQLLEQEMHRILSDMQVHVICRYFGLFDYEQWSLTKIAQEKNVSVYEVHRIKDNALEILKLSPILEVLHGEM